MTLLKFGKEEVQRYILALKNCPNLEYRCAQCPYSRSTNCRYKLMKDAAVIIQEFVEQSEGVLK